MYKIAAVGDFDDTAYFGAIGAEVFSPKSQGDARRLMRKLCGGGYAVIFVSGKYSSEAPANDEATLPAIVPLPDMRGEVGGGALEEALKRAVGLNVNFNR